MARRSKRSRTFNPIDPARGYMWAHLLRAKIMQGLAEEGRGSEDIDPFLAAYYDFRLWDGLLICAQSNMMNLVLIEMIARAGVDPWNRAQIEHRRNFAWRKRLLELQLLFPDGTPDWMVPLLDWVAQVMLTDGY